MRGSHTLSVSSAEWLDAPPDAGCEVRVRWWGEAGEGRVLRPPPPVGSAADHYQAGLSHRRDEVGAATAQYAVRCGRPQLKRYFEDMRELVIELRETRALPPSRDAPPGPPPCAARLPSLRRRTLSQRSRFSRRRAFAYLHLGLAHLDMPYKATLLGYSLAPAQDAEIARRTLSLLAAATPGAAVVHSSCFVRRLEVSLATSFSAAAAAALQGTPATPSLLADAV